MIINIGDIEESIQLSENKADQLSESVQEQIRIAVRKAYCYGVCIGLKALLDEMEGLCPSTEEIPLFILRNTIEKINADMEEKIKNA